MDKFKKTKSQSEFSERQLQLIQQQTYGLLEDAGISDRSKQQQLTEQFIEQCTTAGALDAAFTNVRKSL